MTRQPTIRDLFERTAEPLRLEDLRGEVGFDRAVPGPDISSPGLALAGYVGRFVSDGLQVLGETEVSYLNSLDVAHRNEIMRVFFSFDLPAVFITKGQELPDGLLAAADRTNTPLLRTSLKTAEFYRGVKPVLEDMFAPTATLHGSLADVYGVGLFFTGTSGIGKSECVLDLVERGHRLVADDLVIVSRRGTDVLIGRSHELAAHHMEIRGVGLINVPVHLRHQLGAPAEARRGRRPPREVGQQRTGRAHGTRHRNDIDPRRRDPEDHRSAQSGEEHHRRGRSDRDESSAAVLAASMRAEAFNERLIKRMQKASAIKQYLQEDVE